MHSDLRRVQGERARGQTAYCWRPSGSHASCNFPTKGGSPVSSSRRKARRRDHLTRQLSPATQAREFPAILLGPGLPMKDRQGRAQQAQELESLTFVPWGFHKSPSDPRYKQQGLTRSQERASPSNTGDELEAAPVKKHASVSRGSINPIQLMAGLAVTPGLSRVTVLLKCSLWPWGIDGSTSRGRRGPVRSDLCVCHQQPDTRPSEPGRPIGVVS